MRILRFVLSLAVVTGFAMAQDQPPVKIKKVPVTNTSPASGKEMFDANCASCHGLDAKGHGPAAEALKRVPPDLTQLTKDNKGKFPTYKVQASIHGDINTPAAHGSKDMPIWGELFRTLNSDDAVIQLRVHNLTKYIESLQEK